jgi:hypothetical protein
MQFSLWYLQNCVRQQGKVNVIQDEFKNCNNFKFACTLVKRNYTSTMRR